MTVFHRPIQLLAYSWHNSKITSITLNKNSRKNPKPSIDLEPQIPTFKPLF